MKMRRDCIANGCQSKAGSWPEDCVCYHTGMTWRGHWLVIRAVLPMILVVAVVAGFVMMVRPAQPHPVVAGPVAGPVMAPVAKAITKIFAGAGSSGAVAGPIAGAAIVGTLIYIDVKKRNRCNRYHDLYVDTRADLYPKYTPYRDVCADPKPRKLKAKPKPRRDVVKARG